MHTSLWLHQSSILACDSKPLFVPLLCRLRVLRVFRVITFTFISFVCNPVLLLRALGSLNQRLFPLRNGGSIFISSMSPYISSLPIDPVVPHARRRSRSAASPDSAERSAPAPASSSSSTSFQDVSMEDAVEVTRNHRDPTLGPAIHSPPSSRDAGTRPPRGSWGSPLQARLAEAVIDNPDNNDGQRPRSTGPDLPDSLARPHDADLAHERSWPNTTLAHRAIHEAGYDRMEHLRHVWDSSSQTTLGSVASSPAAMDGLLPEDDGMGVLRRKIIAIQTSNQSSAERSRLVHALMTERYHAQKVALQTAPPPQRAHASDAERPTTPDSASSTPGSLATVSPATSLSSPGIDIQASAKDRRPTFYPPPRDAQEQEATGADKESVLGCEHYQRNVKLQCSACARWYTCRFCHDLVEDHALNRRETQHMLCMFCGKAQPASEQCQDCGRPAAWYYCRICKLWDNDSEKSIYHCDDCGICRVGQGLGKDFFHCKVRPRRVFCASC